MFSLKRTVAIILALATIIWTCNFLTNKFSFKSSATQFSQDMERLASTLSAGDHATFEVTAHGADSVFYLTPYLTMKDIKSAGIVDTRLQRELYELSGSDTNCPALVWVQSDRIMAHYRASPNVWMDAGLAIFPAMEDVVNVEVIKEISTSGEYDQLSFKTIGNDYPIPKNLK